MRKFWQFGTKEKIQRVGLLILIFGLLSFFAWVFLSSRVGFYMDDYYGNGFDFEMPDRYDALFYRLFKWVIPLGLLLTWFYPLWQPIIKWIRSGG